jgi:Holliday junction resolvasome RuvABC ATP-dependent DNA helicase subunit
MNTREMLRKRIESRPGPKRGDALFTGTDYPRRWEDYIGQEGAKNFLRASAASARFRKTKMDHVLIASGTGGIGKSALVRLIAQEMDAGLLEIQGAVDVSEAIRQISSMKDGDILFYDEIHQAISAGRAKAEWLLSYLQDGVIVTPGASRTSRRSRSSRPPRTLSGSRRRSCPALRSSPCWSRTASRRPG